MNTYEMVVLAKSPSEGGFCIAGITLGGSFVRPIYSDTQRSFPRHDISKVRVFSLIKFTGISCGTDFHPEDVLIDGDIQILQQRYSDWPKLIRGNSYALHEFQEYLKMCEFEKNRINSKDYKGGSIFVVNVPKGTYIYVRPHRDPDKPNSKEAFLYIGDRSIKVTAPIDFWHDLDKNSKLTFKQDCYVVITLTMPFKDDYCYLLVSGILSENHEELFNISKSM